MGSTCGLVVNYYNYKVENVIVGGCLGDIKRQNLVNLVKECPLRTIAKTVVKLIRTKVILFIPSDIKTWLMFWETK